MDLFNKKKIKELENKIYWLGIDVHYKELTIKELKKDLAPYITNKDNGFGWPLIKYTLRDAERDIRERDLYISVLEGELGLEKTASAKKKYEALKEIVKNDVLQLPPGGKA